MKEGPMTKEVARRYLLGAVDDSERHRIETMFMTDPETKETILTAEEELLEDYLEGTLSEPDSARFLERYGHEPRQQRRLRITASIREYALSEAQRSQVGISATQWRGFASLSWLRERRFLPIAASLIVLAIGAIWLIQWNNQRQREAYMRLALERELTDLNSPSSLNQNHARILFVMLPPVSLRSINSRPEVTPQSPYEIIELQLILPQTQDVQNYTAVLRRVGETDGFTVANLRREKVSAGTVVKLRLPAKSLPRGPYEISLTGIPNGPAQQYDFVIAD
jgi:hypothetical protein